jgi:predicted ABC-type ATPase
MNIQNYLNFILERSKNDPIPELWDNDKLGIILMGTPGAGKSTFIKEFINPKKNIKSFSSDDVNRLINKGDKDKPPYERAGELNLSRVKHTIKEGQSFIYDTTGYYEGSLDFIYNEIKDKGYKLIFIQIIIDLELSKSRNIIRGLGGGHMSDDNFIELVYNKQFSNMSRYYYKFKPKSFYVILNKNDKYSFFKYDGFLRKRKVDKYI